MVGPFVTRTWWSARAHEVVLADVRRDVPGLSAAAAYAAGHLPGAVFVDLERALAAPPTAEHGRHPLPAPEVFAECMARAGIGDADVVVAYDDADLTDASDPGSVVLDARSAERFAGAPDPLDPRPGHVPGARSLPCREAVDDGGFLLPDDVLRRRLADVGADGTAPVVSYCGSGVTACHTLLVLEHLGLPAGRLYPGSWSQWAADPDRPVELGPGQQAPGARD